MLGRSRQTPYPDTQVVPTDDETPSIHHGIRALLPLIRRPVSIRAVSSRSFAHASPARKAMALIVAVGLALGGCSTGADATVNGGTFQFTSPGDKTEFFYPAAERGAVGELSGPQVGDSTAVALSSFRGKVVVLNAWGAWCPECRAETTR